MLVPGVLALLPEYAGLVDPVAELRTACLEAVAWLGEVGPVAVIADAQGARVARALLATAPMVERRAPASAVETPGGLAAPEASTAYLVVANGTARRSEKAPGHLDERAVPFDEALAEALWTTDPGVLASLDENLAEELLVGNPSGLRALGGLLTTEPPVVVDYDDDPFGVQYWVMRWQCES